MGTKPAHIVGIWIISSHQERTRHGLTRDSLAQFAAGDGASRRWLIAPALRPASNYSLTREAKDLQPTL